MAQNAGDLQMPSSILRTPPCTPSRRLDHPDDISYLLSLPMAKAAIPFHTTPVKYVRIYPKPTVLIETYPKEDYNRNSVVVVNLKKAEKLPLAKTADFQLIEPVSIELSTSRRQPALPRARATIPTMAPIDGHPRGDAPALDPAFVLRSLNAVNRETEDTNSHLPLRPKTPFRPRLSNPMMPLPSLMTDASDDDSSSSDSSGLPTPVDEEDRAKAFALFHKEGALGLPSALMTAFKSKPQAEMQVEEDNDEEVWKTAFAEYCASKSDIAISSTADPLRPSTPPPRGAFSSFTNDSDAEDDVDTTPTRTTYQRGRKMTKSVPLFPPSLDYQNVPLSRLTKQKVKSRSRRAVDGRYKAQTPSTDSAFHTMGPHEGILGGF